MDEGISREAPCPYCNALHTGPCTPSTTPRKRHSSSSSDDIVLRSSRLKRKRCQSPLSIGCDKCSTKFNSRRKLAEHRRAHHLPESKFTCSNCSKTFTSRFKLVRHLIVHAEEDAAPNFTCSVCTRAFRRRDHLLAHFRTHGPRQKLRCSSCPKEYTSSASLRRHIALHMASDGVLGCSICGHVSASAADAVIHIRRTHAGSRKLRPDSDRRFVCPSCPLKFFALKDVRRHSVVHTGTRDFLCQHCPASFGRKDHLIRHISKRHPDSPPTPPKVLPEFSSVFVKKEDDF